MNFKKIIAMTAAMTLCATMFASCGDSSSSEAKTTTAATTTAATTAAPVTTTAPVETEPVEKVDQGPLEFEGYDAFLMFADNSWSWGNWNGHAQEGEAAYGIDADITADGEYTVSVHKDWIVESGEFVNETAILDPDTGEICSAEGTVVFCVDIIGLLYDEEVGLEEGDDAKTNPATKGTFANADDLTVELLSIKADGVEVDFDASKIKYGNIENDNNKYRIEIFNQYGDTAADPAFDPLSLAFATDLSVTFSIAGLDA